MPSDSAVSERLRRAVANRGFIERFFFGGVGFFLNGNFAIGIYHDKLVLRLGEDAAEAAMREKRARPMDLTGRPMRGWVLVEPDAFATGHKLKDWIDRVFDFVSNLPAKKTSTSKRKKHK